MCIYDACVTRVRCLHTLRSHKTGPILERLSKKVEPSSGHARPRIGAIAALRRQDRMRETPASAKWITRDPFRDKEDGKYRYLYHKRFKVSQNLLQLAIIDNRAFPRHVISY